MTPKRAADGEPAPTVSTSPTNALSHSRTLALGTCRSPAAVAGPGSAASFHERICLHIVGRRIMAESH